MLAANWERSSPVVGKSPGRFVGRIGGRANSCKPHGSIKVIATACECNIRYIRRLERRIAAAACYAMCHPNSMAPAVTANRLLASRSGEHGRSRRQQQWPLRAAH